MTNLAQKFEQLLRDNTDLRESRIQNLAVTLEVYAAAHFEGNKDLLKVDFSKPEVLPTDYSLKKGDPVHSQNWTLSELTIVDINWALKAAALKLGETGSIAVWPVAGLSKIPY